MGKKYVIEVEKSDYKNLNGETLWKIQGLNSCILSRDLDKLEEYKEPKKETHEFKVGDMCRWKSVLFTRNNKVFITRITDNYVRYIDKTGECGSMLRGVFEKSADFVNHADIFEVLSDEY